MIASMISGARYATRSTRVKYEALTPLAAARFEIVLGGPV
jgi:hypothetical protein